MRKSSDGSLDLLDKSNAVSRATYQLFRRLFADFKISFKNHVRYILQA